MAMRLNNHGQSLVEFALAGLVFFSLLFAVIDLGFMFYANLTMQHAVREGTRYAVTGQSTLGPDRRSALIQLIKKSSNGLYDKNLTLHDEPGMQNYNNPSISVVKPGNVTFTNYTGTPTTGDPGKPDDVIVVSLTYTWPLITPLLKPFFPGGKYTFTVKSTMKNEGFPTS
jgi:Flp pilus assembly protein TadG